ncbi:hypothetical protein A3850_003090 [Lewinella sp. 4G2]|nr:hypothetical protein A3850_003090 [Lewinella sp. 4G2]
MEEKCLRYYLKSLNCKGRPWRTQHKRQKNSKKAMPSVSNLLLFLTNLYFLSLMEDYNPHFLIVSIAQYFFAKLKNRRSHNQTLS